MAHRISSDVPCGAENVVCTTTDNNTITCEVPCLVHNKLLIYFTFKKGEL